MKKHIKLIIFVIVFFITIGDIGVIAEKQGLTNTALYSSEEEYARNFSEDLYKFFRYGEAKVFSYKRSNIVNAYLNSKKSVLNEVSDLYCLDKKPISLKSEVLKRVKQSGTTIYVVNIRSEFLYSSDTSGESSGEALNIIVKCSDVNGTFTIENVFDGIGGVNIAIWPTLYEKYSNEAVLNLERLENGTLNNKGNIEDLKIQKDKEIDEIKKQFYEEIKLAEKESQNQKKEIKTKSLSKMFNKTGAVNYARRNFNKDSPESGGAGVHYQDFSKFKYSYDCTNFTSHCMLAGGARPDKPGWYYQDMDHKSESWSGATKFNKYFTVRKSVKLWGTSNPYSPFLARTNPLFAAGDFIQVYDGETFVHSTIITGSYTFDNRGKSYVGAKVTGRTSSRSNNNNMAIKDVLPGIAKYLLKVKGI